MTLHIELSPQTEAKLRERAAASGKDIGSYALGRLDAPGENVRVQQDVHQSRSSP